MQRIEWLAMACLVMTAVFPLSAQETKLLKTLGGDDGCVESVAFSPNGKSVAGNCDSMIKVWNTTTGKNTVTFDAVSTVMSVAFSPDGRTVASATCCGGVIELWDVTAGKNDARFGFVGAKKNDTRLDTVGGVRTSLVFSPDGKTLAAAGNGSEQAIQLWDLASGEIIATMSHPNTDFPLAYAPDGKTLAVGIWHSKIAIWDVTTRKNTAMLTGHTGDVTSLAFSPDSKTLVSGSRDHSIKLWTVASGKSNITLTGHTYIVHSVACSADGKTLASGSADGTIRLWDITNHLNP